LRNLILFGLLIILLLAAQFASAKTVDEVIEKYIKARGGKNKLAAVKSIYMAGTKEKMGKEMTVKFLKEQDKLSRTEIIADDESGIVVVTDTEAWTFFPLRSPSAEKIPNIDLAALQTELDIAGPLVDYEAKGNKAELLGKEKVEGTNCYKIKLTTNGGKEMMFWLDGGTYLVVQSSVSPSGGIKATTLTRYLDYKEVDGLQFAHTLETKMVGFESDNNHGAITFHTILINPVIDPTMYQPPNHLF